MLGYAAVFGVFGAILTALIALAEGVDWPLAIPLGAVLATVHAIVCHSAEHIARVSPLRSMRLSITLSTFFAAASAAGALFTAMALGGLALVSNATGDEIFEEAPLFFALGALSYLFAAAYHYLSAARREAMQSTERALEAELSAVEAELRALSAMVNPHFLFNALGSVAALTGSDPAAGRRMCLALAELMRGQLRVGETPFVPFEDELAMLRNYLSIESMRFGERMEIRERIDPACLSWPVPPLVLQPLVENAVKHGIAPNAEMGFVKIAARMENDALSVTIENSTGEARVPQKSRGGVGLDLVRRRLAAVYGGRAWLETGAANSVFQATIRVPRNERNP